MSTKHDLIIEARHILTRRQRALSWLLTLLGWAGWCYLLLPALAVVLFWVFGRDILSVGGDMHRLSENVDILRLYLLIAGTLGGLLVFWSRINLWRFAGVDRRNPIANASIAEIADDLELSAAMLQHGQGGKIVVVHHGAEGGIIGIDVVLPLVRDGHNSERCLLDQR
ncbi:MAG: poly-beta-1,6-N-acetyl-D-glucosamine biosynthesis protein PgaD [Paludibacterium sp.]|uniref:poly-beta-1,6-N-acetyl-D-glucosamine biosynthesis protein PgaD n=1 Tax=Paludibacterium sp. TaxID=1917523 RepID=UPI0025F6B07A|nr:poly-beta-1,6-N-acetyl-D-glucosamine biosynthesis protein PgaD [Paludibacterium sp.]MBV8047396.1 poly-beta-1,6-N-acetyl-D-glucosamine biosynthesis protein PgaD [Paludibacterium sp.]MBV8646857.1 poly-beta-1,6-N-acetyl-D-glucosamine biosynthesis protein PgaD [Paludibacterium sp.]